MRVTFEQLKEKDLLRIVYLEKISFKMKARSRHYQQTNAGSQSLSHLPYEKC